PDDALESLPLGVLLTEEPQGSFVDFPGYAQAPWLARKYAMTVLPSISSLRALRQFAGAAKAAVPVRGVGNPKLARGQQSGHRAGGIVPRPPGRSVHASSTAVVARHRGGAARHGEGAGRRRPGAADRRQGDRGGGQGGRVGEGAGGGVCHPCGGGRADRGPGGAGARVDPVGATERTGRRAADGERSG